MKGVKKELNEKDLIVDMLDHADYVQYHLEFTMSRKKIIGNFTPEM
jgi:hypothetical protein